MNILQISPPHLSHVHTLPWEIQKSHFQQYLYTSAARRSCCLPGLRRGGGRLAGAAVLFCLVWRCELTAGQVRSASECVRRSHCAAPDTLRHRPDTERTCLVAVEPTQFTALHQTRQNSPVWVVSGVAV